jgi:predicted regulator of Ras-like GTPase activity (Roadblock/LC7/MglB family)
VDVAKALADLTEISSQIEQAVVVAEDGSVLGATFDGGERLAEVAARLVREAAGARGREPDQLEAATHGGSVFVLRDAGRTIVATTGPAPTVGLVFYDLKSCLKSAGDDDAPELRRRPAKSSDDGPADAA